MPGFTSEEYADMLLAYGAAHSNTREARRIYQERYPNRRLPDRDTFSTTYRRLRETGNLNAREPRVAVRQLPVEIDHQILAAFEEDPTTSTRVVAAALGVSQWKVWSVIHRDHQHPYHYTKVQGLETGDYERRMNFCRFILHTDVDDPTYLKRILWTDESHFSREGITNLHNLHNWAHDNTHKKRVTSVQRKFSVNVWAGVIGRKIIGPHFLPDILNGESYFEFLMDVLPNLLSEVITYDTPIVFQHDGCPAHFRLDVRELLNNSFPDSWIGRGGPTEWPARSPDLTPLDFYVWGRAKELVYKEEIMTKEELIQKINNAFSVMKEEIRFKVTTTEIRKRYRACIRNRGQQFEQNL